MMAQRFDQARVDAVEIDNDAFEEAKGNITASDFKDRMSIFCGDFLDGTYKIAGFINVNASIRIGQGFI